MNSSTRHESSTYKTILSILPIHKKNNGPSTGMVRCQID